MKKKILASLFGFICLFGISAGFIGCAPEKELYTLTINYNNGINQKTELSVEEGTTVLSADTSTATVINIENNPILLLPSAENITPPNNSLIFDGWYTNIDLTEQFDTTKTIEENIEIFAKWKAKAEYVTLTINYNNGVDQQTELSVEKGSTIISLDSNALDFVDNSPVVILPFSQSINSPHKSLTFDGWYEDSTFTNKFDISKPLEKDTTITAKWKLDENYTFSQIASASMQASGFNVGDIILCKNLSATDALNVGDLILYTHSSKTVFHQIVEITLNDNSALEYKTKGTSSATADAYTVTRDMIVGKYVETIENPEQYLKYIGSILKQKTTT